MRQDTNKQEMPRAIGRWCRHWRDLPDCSPASSRPRTGTAGRPTSARFAVGRLVGGYHVVGQPAPVADLVTLLSGPPLDRLGVLSGLPRLPLPAASAATATHPPGMLQIGRQKLIELGGVLLAQLDFVVAAVVAEPHRRRRRRAIEVIDQLPTTFWATCPVPLMADPQPGG